MDACRAAFVQEVGERLGGVDAGADVVVEGEAEVVVGAQCLKPLEVVDDEEDFRGVAAGGGGAAVEVGRQLGQECGGLGRAGDADAVRQDGR